jgi:hypothetical protein
MKTGLPRTCVRGHEVGVTPDAVLLRMNKNQSDMNKNYNRKTGIAWLSQNAYNMAVRMELRRRGLEPAPIKGTKR